MAKWDDIEYAVILEEIPRTLRELKDYLFDRLIQNEYILNPLKPYPLKPYLENTIRTQKVNLFQLYIIVSYFDFFLKRREKGESLNMYQDTIAVKGSDFSVDIKFPSYFQEFINSYLPYCIQALREVFGDNLDEVVYTGEDQAAAMKYLKKAVSIIPHIFICDFSGEDKENAQSSENLVISIEKTDVEIYQEILNRIRKIIRKRYESRDGQIVYSNSQRKVKLPVINQGNIGAIIQGNIVIPGITNKIFFQSALALSYAIPKEIAGRTMRISTKNIGKLSAIVLKELFGNDFDFLQELNLETLEEMVEELEREEA